MPKIGMEPQRKAALIDAAIHEIGARGSLEVTVAQIARRAGVSSALAHHYFGGKEDLFLAAMRHVLREFGRAVRSELSAAQGPRGRAEGILRASFAPVNFRAETVSAWLNFYVLALTNAEARRMLRAYQQRLRSNLRHALRPLAGAGAPAAAERLAAGIDGLYLREGLSGTAPDGARATAEMLESLAREMLQ
ncbi:choline-binding transcriptional repressor BetI [Wenxinia saemankumensis]|uniref:HTH-type transcriptional regulator BetI n=1 Tax=Wenxinia saemankumensis TaxID=1447782 RepID=A0A1M6ARX3_9RHOB|nr:transcriptional regulator BetI [Wenxinia saemankumensis]SHI38953.1 transcriptional regulator, TetR family [Wenxinia saemankumensis]